MKIGFSQRSSVAATFACFADLISSSASARRSLIDGCITSRQIESSFTGSRTRNLGANGDRRSAQGKHKANHCGRVIVDPY